MKHFWALPAFLRLALASQHQFNVYDDLLAYPQYEVIIADNVISEENAQSALDAIAARSSSQTPGHIPGEPHPTPESSLHRFHDAKTEGRLDGANDDEEEEDILSYEDMILNDRRYLCSIPRIADTDTASNNTKVSAEDEEKELVRASNRGWELLKSMDGSCLYFYSGWWSYSFCYGDGVRQFHQLPPGKGIPIYPPVEDKSVNAFVLGKYYGEQKSLDGREDGSADAGAAEKETGVAKLETKGELRYLVQNLAGGTTCDLTGKERRIEVQFRCQPNQVDKIALIKETTTCQYLMIIDTPRLCNDVAFLPPQEAKPNAIACTPVLPAASIPSYLAARESQAVSEDERLAQKIEDEINDAINLLETGQAPLRRETRDVVGDVEIGAHRLVPVGKKLEKGVIVGGGKEKFVATIARSGGFVAPEKELNKVGIKGAKDVDGIKMEVERAAEGRSWRLDVVETPRGKELRGVIETTDDEEKDGGGGDGGQRETQNEGAGGGDAGEQEPEHDQHEGSEETYKEEL